MFYFHLPIQVNGDRDMDEIFFEICRVLDFAFYGRKPVSIYKLYTSVTVIQVLELVPHPSYFYLQ